MGEFFVKLLLATAPLLVWAGHFFFGYAYTAGGCAAGKWVLVAVSLLAAGVVALMLAAGMRQVRREGPRPSLLAGASAGCAAFALAGIAWSSAPVLLLESCR